MSRMAARSSSPRRLLRRIRRRCLSTTSLPKPTERSSTVTSPSSSRSFSLLVFFFLCCCSPPLLLASRPSASRLFFRYRIPHALHSDCAQEHKDRSGSAKNAQIGNGSGTQRVARVLRNEIRGRIGTHHGAAGAAAPERRLGGVALRAGLGLAGSRALIRIQRPAPLLRHGK